MNAVNPLPNLNPPLWLRTLLYLVAAVGELTRQLAVDETWIDRPVDRYISGLIALVLLLAVGNGVAQVAAKTSAARRRERAK